MHSKKNIILKSIVTMNTGPRTLVFVSMILILLGILPNVYSQQYYDIVFVQNDHIAIERVPDIDVGDRLQIVRLVKDVEILIGEAEVDRISPNYCRMAIISVEPGYMVNENDRIRTEAQELDVGAVIEEEHKPEEELPIEVARTEPEPEPEDVQDVEQEPEPTKEVEPEAEPEPEPESLKVQEVEREPEPVQADEPEPEPEPKDVQAAQREPETEPEPTRDVESEPEPQKPIPVPAQAGEGRIPYRAGLRGGITIDATVDYTPDANLSFDEISPNMMMGFAFGALFDIHVWGSLYLDFAPLYSITCSEWEITNGDEEITTNRSFHYLGVPIALKYHIGPLYLLGGVNFLSVMDAGQEDSDSDVILDIKDDLNTSFIAYDVGAGLEYRISSKTSILVEGRFTISQSNMISDTDDHFEELMPGGFQVLAGVIFDMQRLL
jgi:hypothetical protein